MISDEKTPEEQIKRILKDKGIKQKHIAKKINKSEIRVSKILNGKSEFSALDFIKILKVLKMTPNEIMEY